MEQNNIKRFFSALTGMQGIDATLTLVHEIGTVVMPLLMKAAALVFAAQAVQTLNLHLCALAVGTWLLGSGFQWFFDIEDSAFIN